MTDCSFPVFDYDQREKMRDHTFAPTTVISEAISPGGLMIISKRDWNKLIDSIDKLTAAITGQTASGLFIAHTITQAIEIAQRSAIAENLGKQESDEK